MTRRGRLERPVAARAVGTWLVPLMGLLAADDYRGVERFPRHGACILAFNHVTKIDPMLVVRFIWRQGRMPRFLAKRELFDIPVIGRALTWLQQIPVERGGGGRRSMQAAEAWLARGACVQVYPEGTLTRDPDLWPMRGQSGVVRLSLDSGAPILPIAQWGAQDVLPRYSSRPRLFPRHTFRVQVGEPISADRVREWTSESGMRGATDRVMLEITSLLEQLRGPKPTDVLWNPARPPARPGPPDPAGKGKS